MGGLGADVLVYRAVTDSGTGPANRDVITDFTPGQDKIDLSAIDADSSTPGNQAFHFAGVAPFDATPGCLRLVLYGGFMVLAGDIDGDGVRDFSLEILGTVPTTAADFVL